jgi:hypothetical protein
VGPESLRYSSARAIHFEPTSWFLMRNGGGALPENRIREPRNAGATATVSSGVVRCPKPSVDAVQVNEGSRSDRPSCNLDQ